MCERACDLFWEWTEALGALGKMVERKGVKQTHFYHEADTVLLLPIASKMIEPSQIQEQRPATSTTRATVPIWTII